MDYTQIQITNITQAESEIFIAQLSEIGFDGFEEEVGQLNAFIPTAQFDEIALKNVLNNTSYTKSTIAKQNWNAIWESGFEPISVPYPNTDHLFVHIRAHFHKPNKVAKYDIEITPKMSFGTGHHATTFLMVQQMSAINFENKSVIDFGTGTGILAIVASKMGAVDITAIDIDEWSIINASENASVNNCNYIKFLHDDKLVTNKKADIMLANINLNIISAHIHAIKAATISGGIILFSGIMLHDEAAIIQVLQNAKIPVISLMKSGDWIQITCENSFI